MKFITNLALSILCLAVLLQPKEVISTSDVDKHLDIFSEFNTYKHDNIDDEVDHHEHRHRHSENGEEHEHSHGHSKNFHQVEMKLGSTIDDIRLFLPKTTSNISFQFKSLMSSPHPQEIFRPPVV